MFSVRLVSADSYQATPLPQLDPTFSEFRGAEIKHVPVVRVFGTTPTGDKTCLHLHGAFPYLYVPCIAEDSADGFAYRLAASLDAAINISLGSAKSNTQHVYQIQKVAGIPFYGYHKREHQFFKVSFYNPAMMKKAVDLLQNGSVLNQSLQPYEAHIPFILQFMMDYNVHGMSMINLSRVKHRRMTQSLSEFKLSNDSIVSPVDDVDYLPLSVERQSICKIEVDAMVTDILNRQDLEKGIELNPGLAAIWEEERTRRAQAGLPCDDSELVNPKSPLRPPYRPTDSDVYQERRLSRRLEMISQCDELSGSSSIHTTVYPAEVQKNEQIINASNLGTFSSQNMDKTQNEIRNFESLKLSQDATNLEEIDESNILNSSDMPLVDILMDLARNSEKTERADDDSILGTQSSTFCNEDNKSDSGGDEDDDNIDFNLTCLELDSFSPWESVKKTPSQFVPVTVVSVKTAESEMNINEILTQDTDTDSHDSEDSRLPQLDGAGDLLSSFLESEEEENVKVKEVKKGSEHQKSLLDVNKMYASNSKMACNHEETIIGELVSSDSGKLYKYSNASPTSLDAVWSSFLPTDTSQDKYMMVYPPLDSEFEYDLENMLNLTIPPNSNDSSIESESIPLEMVLNGDPCFTQTAEMDKSDLAELQDQYASLLGSALVPDIYPNYRSNYKVNLENSQLECNNKCTRASSDSHSIQFSNEKTACNLSSENVAPNIQEPNTKTYKSKYNHCKDFSRLHTNDNSDYNCNLVARWEELQDVQFIPKRILKKKTFTKPRKQVLSRSMPLSDSMVARKKGYFRRGTANLADKIFSTKNSIDRIHGELSNTLLNSLPLETNENDIVHAPNKIVLLKNYTGTKGGQQGDFIENSWNIKSSIEDLHVAPNVTSTKTDNESPTSIGNDLSRNISEDYYSSDPMEDIRNTLPGVQYSTYPSGENENLVIPILEDFEELVNTQEETNINRELSNQPLSYYSSVRSHSGVPFGMYNHHHCLYSFIHMAFVEDYIFTSDQIWVIEKRNRGRVRPLSPTKCTQNCRLPIVLLKKLNPVTEKKVTNFFNYKIAIHNALQNIDNICNNSDIVNICEKNGNECISQRIDNLQGSNLDIECVNINLTSSVFDKVPLEIVDEVTFTQSAQISSTQNIDHINSKNNDGPVIIKRVFEEMSKDGTASTKKRSIILKLGNRDPFSMKERCQNNFSEPFSNSTGRVERKKRGRSKSLRTLNKRVIQSFNEPSKINKVDNCLLLMSSEMPMQESSLHNRIINNTCTKVDEIIPDYNCMKNSESNFISSSHSDVIFSAKRPEIWCSISKRKINFSFLSSKSSNSSGESDHLELVNAMSSDVEDQRKSITIRNIETLPKKYGIKIFSSNYISGQYCDTPIMGRTLKSTALESIIDVPCIEEKFRDITNEDIPTDLEVQQLNNFDDATLDVLCDSIHKDDTGSINNDNIFENSASFPESTILIPDCGHVDELQSYNSGIVDNFYACKNYTIDAITVEIPHCLFEEDSNSENLQKRLSESLIDSTLVKRSNENSSTLETCNDNLSNNHSDDGCELDISPEKSSSNNFKNENDLLIHIPECSINSSSDELEEFTPPGSSEIFKLINRSNSSYDCSTVSSRTSSPGLDSLSTCSDYCDTKCFDEEENITRMIKSILVLTDDKETNFEDNFNDNTKSFILEKNCNLCNDTKDEHDSSYRHEDYQMINDSSHNDTDKNSNSTKSEYSPNKISIIRRIYGVIAKGENIIKENIACKTDSHNLSNAMPVDVHIVNDVHKPIIDTNNSTNSSNFDKTLMLENKYSNVSCDDQMPAQREDGQSENESNNNEIIRETKNFDQKSVKNNSMENDLNSTLNHNIVNNCELEYNFTEDNSSNNNIKTISSCQIIKSNELNKNNIVLSEPGEVEKITEDAEFLAPIVENTEFDIRNNGDTINVLQNVKTHDESNNNHNMELPQLEIPNKMATFCNEVLELNESESFIRENEENTLYEAELSSESSGNKLNCVIKNNMYSVTEGVEKISDNRENISEKNVNNNLIPFFKSPKFDCKKVSVRLVRINLNCLNPHIVDDKNDKSHVFTNFNGVNLNTGLKTKTSVIKRSVRFNEKVLILELNEIVPLIGLKEEAHDHDRQTEIQSEKNNELSDSLFEYGNESSEKVKNINSINIEDVSRQNDSRVTVVENEDSESYFEVKLVTSNEKVCKKFSNAAKKDRNFKCDYENLNKLTHLKGIVKKKKYIESLENNARKKKNLKLTADSLSSNKTINTKLPIVKCKKKFNEKIEFPITESNYFSNNEQVGLDSMEKIYVSSINKADKSLNDTVNEDQSKELIGEKREMEQCPNKRVLDDSIDKFIGRNAELTCKRKRNDQSKQFQLNVNTTKDDIAFVNSSLQGDSEQKLNVNNRLLHTYRILTTYRNKVHTLSIDQRMVFTRVTISNQEFYRKSVKEEFLEGIGLYPLKSRRCDWQPEHTITGFIQLQKPQVILQRLTPSELKLYGYTRRFKSNRLGKRFKMDANRFIIPAYDGAADLSSSDSEEDMDRTLESIKKRVCIYKSRRNIEQELVVTPRKRKNMYEERDDTTMNIESKSSTSKQGIATLRNSYSSPSRTGISRSPSLSGTYSPLKIIVTSPKVHRDTQTIDLDPSRNDSHPANVTNPFLIHVTPKKRAAHLHDNLFRDKIGVTLSTKQQEKNNSVNTIMKQQFPGELNILDMPSTSSCYVESISSTYVAKHSSVNESQDVLSSIKDTATVRKNLFLSMENDLRIGENLYHEAREKNKINKATNPKIGKDEIAKSGEDDDQDRVTFDQSTMDFKLQYSSSTLSEERINYDDDLCNVTFTQYLNSQRTKQRILFTNQNQGSFTHQPCTIIPKFNPVTIQRVIDTMEVYKIPKYKNLQPFFSKQADACGHQELAHKILKVPGKGLVDLPHFESNIKSITGINHWRRMKVNEFHPSGEAFKSTITRRNLAGYSSVVITPLSLPPPIKSVTKWTKARNYLKMKSREEEKCREKGRIELEVSKVEKFNCSQIIQGDESSNSSNSIIEPSPEKIAESNLSKIHGCKSKTISKKLSFDNTCNIIETSYDSIIKTPICQNDNHNNSAPSRENCSKEAAPSFLSILEKSNLFKENEPSKHFGISYGQIECASNPNRSNVSNENRQKAKALITYQFITILCVEVHVVTREDLLPDPEYDSISALFYAVQSDVPPTSKIKPLEHGVIAIDDHGISKFGYSYGSTLPFKLTTVSNEDELFNVFIGLVIRIDPEILIGWEIESLSWGYIFQRASRLGVNLSKRISRIPSVQSKWETPEVDLDALAEMRLPGRIVLDIWRIMRGEIALLTYTFENVMYYVMNERIPYPSFKTLSTWWESSQPPLRWKVVQHYSFKVLGVLRILEQLDIIGRTSEHARLFGIQFYEVFSRGSQYRVESIMLRLSKPLNYIPVSPSPIQRASMRAMEALPLIMEPEAMFYSDPIIVLDFQSLYPSIIIAHNYCFSTCLGRIEHIGEQNPFEFGAHVLRINKNTALKLRGKVNYAPCGVAFVKPEIRRGILPRMLTEILETRFMVKKAMKDHSQDDKLLQRVLHSRQHGLKYLANVTYGYTAANFSGRMPCVELGDSVISKAKETLERAIKLVESTANWGAKVVYGDTDSLFILVSGKSKLDAFKIGGEIADAVTESNLTPIKLKFEKVLYPAILQTKKRYCGYMWEKEDQKEPSYLAKGIETVRRDGCPAVSKILEKSLKILFDTNDVSLVKKYVVRQLDKVVNGKVSIQDLTFAKEFRGLKGYKEKACVPALELTRRLIKKDPRAIPRRGERVRYVIIAGAPNQALIHCVRSPLELINDPGLRPNGTYYASRVIIPPLNRCLNLMGVDVNAWYKEMPHRHILDNPVALPRDKQKQTLFQYFGTIICVACGKTSNKGICDGCISNPTETLTILNEKLRCLERLHYDVTSICQSCIGDGNRIECHSLDCSVFYRHAYAKRELSQEIEIRRIIKDGYNMEF